MQIVKPKQLASKNLKILCYGPSGTGKTYFAGSARNGLMLDLEKGSISAKNQNIDVMPVNSAAEFKEATESIADMDYETIIVDSITRYGEMLFATMKQYYPSKSDSMTLWGEFDTTIRQRTNDLLSFDDKNIIITALEEDLALDGGFPIKYPSLKAKKFKLMLPSLFDLVLYFSPVDGKQCIHIAPSDSHITKNRLSNIVELPELIMEDDELFDVNKIIELITQQ